MKHYWIAIGGALTSEKTISHLVKLFTNIFWVNEHTQRAGPTFLCSVQFQARLLWNRASQDEVPDYSGSSITSL